MNNPYLSKLFLFIYLLFYLLFIYLKRVYFLRWCRQQSWDQLQSTLPFTMIIKDKLLNKLFITIVEQKLGKKCKKVLPMKVKKRWSLALERKKIDEEIVVIIHLVREKEGERQMWHWYSSNFDGAKIYSPAISKQIRKCCSNFND